MSTANLINLNDPAIEFWEAMIHRSFLGAMAPLTRFSALPYLLDPLPAYATPAARFWLMNHQRAQTDAISTIPTWGFAGTGFPPYPGTLEIAVPENQNLQDTNFTNPAERTWFGFVNQMEMYVAESFLPPLLVLPAW